MGFAFLNQTMNSSQRSVDWAGGGGGCSMALGRTCRFVRGVEGFREDGRRCIEVRVGAVNSGSRFILALMGRHNVYNALAWNFAVGLKAGYVPLRNLRPGPLKG